MAKKLTKKAKRAVPQHHSTDDMAASIDGIEARLVAYAEQLGWVVGTVQAKAEGWLDRAALAENLTHIRDGAAALLTHLGSTSPAAPRPANLRGRQHMPSNVRPSQALGQGRSGGVVDAPGKRHRTPPPPSRGVKHSDERIAKATASATNRRGGRKRS